MTPAAVGSELAVVDIVAFMAIAALAAQALLGLERLSVAGLAVRGTMCSVQHEVCLSIVIEAPLRPFDRRVAHCTIVGETIVVRVVMRVTATAVDRCIPEYLGLVAGRAFGIGMLAQEGEVREAVVEEQVFFPGHLVVAVGARRSLGAAMGVVVFVTLAAGCERLRLEDRLDMAG